MTNAEAKEILEANAVPIFPLQIVYQDWLTAMHMALEALKNQATSEWIPVSERLPDKNGTYLITVSSYDETASIEYITVDHGNSDGGFLHFKTKKNPKVKSGEVVTAWMPAPEPYEEGGNDD